MKHVVRIGNDDVIYWVVKTERGEFLSPLDLDEKTGNFSVEFPELDIKLKSKSLKVLHKKLELLP